MVEKDRRFMPTGAECGESGKHAKQSLRPRHSYGLPFWLVLSYNARSRKIRLFILRLDLTLNPSQEIT